MFTTKLLQIHEGEWCKINRVTDTKPAIPRYRCAKREAAMCAKGITMLAATNN
jgi:hypothetical protein